MINIYNLQEATVKLHIFSLFIVKKLLQISIFIQDVSLQLTKTFTCSPVLMPTCLPVHLPTSHIADEIFYPYKTHTHIHTSIHFFLRQAKMFKRSRNEKIKKKSFSNLIFEKVSQLFPAINATTYFLLFHKLPSPKNYQFESFPMIIFYRIIYMIYKQRGAILPSSM